MLFPLTADDLTSALPSEEIVRADPSVAAEVIGDPAAVAFLSEVGVPWCCGVFQMHDSLAAASTPDDLVIAVGAMPTVIETPVAELGSLGSLMYVSVYVRRSDGAVFATLEDTVREAPAARRIEGPGSGPRRRGVRAGLCACGRGGRGGDAGGRPGISRRLAIRATDPAPFADPKRFWTGYLESYSGGMHPRLER